MQYMDSFGYKQDSNCWQASKVFCQLFGVSATEGLIRLHPSKILSYSETMRVSLADGQVFQIFLIIITPPNTHEFQLGKEDTITAADVLLAVTTLKVWGGYRLRWNPT